MKKLFITFFIILIILILFIFINRTLVPTTQNTQNNENSTNNTSTTPTQIENIDKSTVSYNGWLSTDGSKLRNSKNEIVQLRGISSHGIEWFYDIITYENLKSLKNDWNTNVFRIAMYTDSHGTGYIYNKEETIKKVHNIIDMAISLDMYVIIDWHILLDNNPQIHKEDSKIFFEELSKKYANIPNVIYEICNEPNGNNVTWEKDIKPYAEEIIPIIRNHSKKSLIIVGTPDWCKQLKVVADNPLSFENIVYSCHFYSGTHKNELREKISYCINKNIPIFISECGLTQASGDGGVYFNEFSEWISYLNSNNISWIYWSFCNKNEDSAILLPEYAVSVQNTNVDTNINNNIDNNNSENSTVIENENSNENILTSNNSNTENKDNFVCLDFNDYLTEAGKFVKNIFLTY